MSWRGKQIAQDTVTRGQTKQKQMNHEGSDGENLWTTNNWNWVSGYWSKDSILTWFRLGIGESEASQDDWRRVWVTAPIYNQPIKNEPRSIISLVRLMCHFWVMLRHESVKQKVAEECWKSVADIWKPGLLKTFCCQNWKWCIPVRFTAGQHIMDVTGGTPAAEILHLGQLSLQS